MNGNEVLRKLLSDSRKSNAAKQFIDSIKKLDTVLNEKTINGASSEYIQQLKQSGRGAIITDLISNRQKESIRLNAEMDKCRDTYTKKYEKDYSLHDFRIRQYELSLSGMTRDELKQESTKYINNPKSINDPNLANTLFSVLNNKGLEEESAQSRMIGKQNKYDMPWLSEPEGAVIDAELKLNVSDGDTIYIKTDEGIAGFSYDEVAELSKEASDE